MIEQLNVKFTRNKCTIPEYQEASDIYLQCTTPLTNQHDYRPIAEITFI